MSTGYKDAFRAHLADLAEETGIDTAALPDLQITEMFLEHQRPGREAFERARARWHAALTPVFGELARIVTSMDGGEA